VVPLPGRDEGAELLRRRSLRDAVGHRGSVTGGLSPSPGARRVSVPSVSACIVCDHPGPFAPLFEQGGHRLVRCPRCSLVFQDPPPDPAVLDAAYYHDPAFTEALFGPLREWTLERARAKLGPVSRAGGLRPGGRALDVGCSSGAWVETVVGAGMAATGVEIGAATAERARALGLDVRTGTLAEVAPTLPAGGYDLVTFWDVLEHLPAPRADLALAAGLLAPGGMLAATFPNADGLYPRLTHRLIARRTGVWEYPELPVHLYDFSTRTAPRLLARAGYGVIELRTENTPFAFYRNTSLSSDRLGRGVRGRALRLAFEALRLPAYPLARLTGRGNYLFVAARAGVGAPSRQAHRSPASWLGRSAPAR